MAIKLLIGGSPCTHWSIAQKNNRETVPEGEGWELLKNYLIAREKFQPDFFLYENNKSASQPIKDQIAYEFGVGVDEDVRFTYINSALVSAQNRQRFYVTNFGDIEMPQDRGILLKDILETGEDLTSDEKSYCLTGTYNKAAPRDTLKKSSRSMVAEPIRVGCMPSPDGTIKNSQAKRVYSVDGNSVNLVANGGGEGAKTGLYAIPVNTTTDGKSQTMKAQYYKNGMANFLNDYSKGCLYGASGVAEPVGTTVEGKSFAVTAYYSTGQNVPHTLTKHKGTMVAEHIGYAEPIEFDEYGRPTKAISGADGKTYTVYEVKDGIITIKGKEYPIKLADGFYIIRKLTVTECCRLQTMPDDYCKAVSDSQAYKGLGNGWTAEVIIHLLNHALKDVPRDEELIVLSMYDGIGTGRYCLDKMGFTNIKYYAYEIDKYPIAIAMDNYPDIIQCGDAFAVREEDWEIHSKR